MVKCLLIRGCLVAPSFSNGWLNLQNQVRLTEYDPYNNYLDPTISIISYIAPEVKVKSL